MPFLETKNKYQSVHFNDAVGMKQVGGGGDHALAKFRISMIHRFMTLHPVAELLPCFRARHKHGRYLVSSLFLPTG